MVIFLGDLLQYYLFVNFKTYEEASSQRALSLARLLSSFYTGEVEIIPVCQSLDIEGISREISLKIFAQHADPFDFGSNTGKIVPRALQKSGAFGTILNHAENKVSNEHIKNTIERCRGAGLKVMVCAESLQRAKEIAAFSPDFIAIEPPELIGGNISVSSAKPELISGSVEAIKKIDPKIIVITGAGIKTGQDVAAAIKLGTAGVFVASGIVLAQDKEYAIRTLLEGFPSRDSDKVEP